MLCLQMNGCCSVLELQDFHNNTTIDDVIQSIVRKLQYHINYNNNEMPKTYVATTRSDTQENAERILTELGFKYRTFASRHDKKGEKSLKFWRRFSHPPQVKQRLKELT